MSSSKILQADNDYDKIGRAPITGVSILTRSKFTAQLFCNVPWLRGLRCR